jgi:hypothetical protein
MKLTTEQIAKINQTLIEKGLIYEDIKLELIDHIASEIEAEMEEKEISFETAFKKAFENWKEQLRPSSSFWLRGNKSIPKIISYKCNQMIKRVFLMSITMGLVTAFLVTLIFKKIANEEVLFLLNSILKVISISGIMLFIYCKYRLWQSKRKSSYSYLFSQNGFGQIFNLIFIATGCFKFNGNTTFFNFHFMNTFFPITLLFISAFYLTLVFKHLIFIKNIELC